jgi:hypothetical protein
MTRSNPRSQPAWTDVKRKIAEFDRPGLLALIHDLYSAQEDNRIFLHARFGLGDDVLKPYKERLCRWLSPDVLRNQDTSVLKAKQAISGYQKAVGEPAGLAELMIFYCECAAQFCSDLGSDDESYLNTLVRMFEQALKVIGQLPTADREIFLARLHRVRGVSRRIGYGVGDVMDDLLVQYAAEPTRRQLYNQS